MSQEEKTKPTKNKMSSSGISKNLTFGQQQLMIEYYAKSIPDYNSIMKQYEDDRAHCIRYRTMSLFP